MIGCGSVAEMKSGPAFNKVPHSQLMAVMRRDEALLKEYALRHQVPQTFTNALELIHHPGIDAIYSLRITQSRRCTAYRDGDFMRLLTVAPEHDSTYGRK